MSVSDSAGHVVPASYEQFVLSVTNRYSSLSPQNKIVGSYIVQHPNEVAVHTAKDLAVGMGVQASTLVRFAQAFGFSGFPEMQKLFQARLAAVSPSFNQRLTALRDELRQGGSASNSPLLRDLAARDIVALERLADSQDDKTLDKVATMLAEARTIHLLGQFRSYPVAVYLRYVLLHLRKDCRLLDGAGGLAAEQAAVIDSADVVIAISFKFYAREVVDLVEKISKMNVPIVSITDTPLSPLVKCSKITLFCPEAGEKFSHSLAAPMCLAQGLAMSMADKMQVEPR